MTFVCLLCVWVIPSLLFTSHRSNEEQAEWAMDRLLVDFGREILKIVLGRVSTEVDACLSFEMDATIAKALRLMEMYEDDSIKKDCIHLGRYPGCIGKHFSVSYAWKSDTDKCIVHLSIRKATWCPLHLDIVVWFPTSSRMCRKQVSI